MNPLQVVLSQRDSPNDIELKAVLTNRRIGVSFYCTQTPMSDSDVKVLIKLPPLATADVEVPWSTASNADPRLSYGAAVAVISDHRTLRRFTEVLSAGLSSISAEVSVEKILLTLITVLTELERESVEARQREVTHIDTPA